MSNEEKRAVIVTGEQDIVAGPPVGDWFNCKSCGRPIRLDANTAKCYVCNQIAREEALNRPEWSGLRRGLHFANDAAEPDELRARLRTRS